MKIKISDICKSIKFGIMSPSRSPADYFMFILRLCTIPNVGPINLQIWYQAVHNQQYNVINKIN